MTSRTSESSSTAAVPLRTSYASELTRSGRWTKGMAGHGIAVVGQPVGTSVEITDSLISGNGGNGVWINSNNVALGASVLRNNTTT